MYVTVCVVYHLLFYGLHVLVDVVMFVVYIVWFVCCKGHVLHLLGEGGREHHGLAAALLAGGRHRHAMLLDGLRLSMC